MGNRVVSDIDLAMNLVKLVVLVILIFLKVGQGDAIQCFVCNSKSDPRCADPIQTDWQGQDQDQDSESDDSNENNASLFPVECHLAVQYSAGIQAVSDLLRGFGHARLGLPDLWISTSASLSPNSGLGSSGNPGGYNKGYGGKGYRGNSAQSLNTGTYGGQRDQDESIGCHKVIYTDSSGDTVVDRGCAPARIANMEPCSALDSATNSDGNGSGNTANSGSGNSYKHGFGSGYGGGSSGGSFDISQINPDFCEVCNDDHGCNRATSLNGANWIFTIICILSILNGHAERL